MPKRFPKLQPPQRWQANLKQHPTHAIALAVALTIGLFAPQVAMNWRTYQDSNRIRQRELQLKHLSDRITYLDEVLTMSAFMNAATGDQTWEQRYRQFAPQLDAAIQESINLVPHVYANDDAKQVDIANKELVAMEDSSFQLVKQNQPQAALRLLKSPAYNTQKRIYANGVTQRNLKIQQQLQAQSEGYNLSLQWSLGTMGVSILLLIPTWLIVLQLLRSYLHDRILAEVALHQKNQDLIAALENLQQAQRLIQTEKLSSLAQMVAGIAHEINNPISFISGNLTYLEQYTNDLLAIVTLYQQQLPQPPAIILKKLAEAELEFLTHDLQEILRSMRSGSRRVEEIVLGLRTFSRLGESDRKSVDLHPGLESAILLLQHQLRAKPNQPEIQLIRNYGELPDVSCSPSQLNQVFHGILLNAIDAIVAANPEAPMIQIRTDLIDENWARITISDNGIGIPSAIQSKIFDPFFTTKPIGKGKGLGLSIAYQIITECHQGKLYCSSSPTEGTEFVIEIPLN